jgi:hypothetical protein
MGLSAQGGDAFNFQAGVMYHLGNCVVDSAQFANGLVDIRLC